MKIVVLTTSYPRGPGDVAGLFVADQVEHLRARGVEMEVVSPASFRHYGIAYGVGRRREPAPQAVPGGRAAADADGLRAGCATGLRRRGSRPCPLAPAGLVAMATRKPFVVQVWGTDIELARRAPALARRVLQRARLVIAPSTALADEARRLGATDVRTIPSGVELPVKVADPADPPEILYAGRLSPEKGVRELVAAAEGMPLVVVGDGPLRGEVPDALGFLPHEELERRFERAAVVACPSHREGFGVVCAEAMAYGRPVVAGRRRADCATWSSTRRPACSSPRSDVEALRDALRRLLADRDLRRRFGEAGRARIAERFTWERFADETLRAYDDALH